MGGREAGSRHKEPLGSRVTVGHKASTAVGPSGMGSGDCTSHQVTVALALHQTGRLRLQANKTLGALTNPWLDSLPLWAGVGVGHG